MITDQSGVGQPKSAVGRQGKTMSRGQCSCGQQEILRAHLPKRIDVNGRRDVGRRQVENCEEEEETLFCTRRKSSPRSFSFCTPQGPQGGETTDPYACSRATCLPHVHNVHTRLAVVRKLGQEKPGKVRARCGAGGREGERYFNVGNGCTYSVV